MDAVREAFILRNQLRQRCRTDLLFLCGVLGYRDVSRKVHGPILDALQKFPGGKESETNEHVWQYEPLVPHWQLEGSRQNLILYPRGHLKTTIATIAHTIQWVLNYPNIRVLISTAIGEQCELVLGSILNQFRFNQQFRALFPEFCPAAEKAADFGNKGQFTVPNRTDHTLKEATVWTCSVGKVIAGFRADVIKHSDLVDQQNCKTPGGIAEVISHFGHVEPLLERYNARDGFDASRGWNDVEGTRYDFGDLYGHLLKSKDWTPVVRSAIQEDGTSLWEERFPLKELERIRRQPTVGDWIFSAQYLNRCIPQGDGLCDPKDVAFVPANVVRDLLPRLRLHVTIDLHGMEQSNRSDFTCMTLGGFDHDGRLYIVDMKLGRFNPEEVIDHIFDWHRRYPRIIAFKVEKDAHARVLLPFLSRETSKRQSYPRIVAIPRDTHTSKKHRIRGLRPWFKKGIIVFSEALPLHVKQELLDEVAQFPSESTGVHDDALDTLADLMQDSDSETGITSDVMADSPVDVHSQFGKPRPPDRFLGFDEWGQAQWLYGPQGETRERKITGVL